MRSESCKQETESESNYSDWEQTSAALVNSDHNILATPNTTLLEVYFTFYSASNRGWLCHYVANAMRGMNIEGLLESNCMSIPKTHSSVTWKVKNIPTQKRKNKKSKIY